MQNNKILTAHEQKLFNALVERGVEVEAPYNDGHKTVDMAVRSARLFIEVDNLDHFTKSDQIIRDLQRSHFSDGDDYRTFYVTNQILDRFNDEVADALKEVVDKLKKVEKPDVESYL
jgi:very-short-patch-repair endonuclease